MIVLFTHAKSLLLGELKTTMLQSYLKEAKLRSWLPCSKCLMAIHECKILLDKAYCFLNGNSNITHNSLIMTIELPKATKVLHDLQDIVGWQTAVLCAHVKDRMSMVYSCTFIHTGNSLILFYPQGNHLLEQVPDSIKYIFEDGDSFTFVVQRQLPLNEGKQVLSLSILISPHDSIL